MYDPAVRELTIHAQLAAAAARWGERVAIWQGDVSVTFAELRARAMAVAEALRARGVRAGDRVPVELPRGIEMIATLWGVMEVGAAYVPMDPAYPAERRTLMAEDSAAGGPSTGAAYCIYTSGSTGRPKGVVVGHDNVDAFMRAMDERVGVPAPGVWLALTTISFDIAALELWWTLTRGWTVVLLDGDAIGALERELPETVVRRGVTGVQCTPSFARAWLEVPAAEAVLGRIERFLVGGEALPAELARRLAARVGGAVINMYGPTETTIWSTTKRIARGAEVTLGSAIPGTECWIDGGDEGELLIGGLGVARGYHGRADLTAERFVPDVWSGRAGARVYRTGDLVRRRPPVSGASEDGELVFLGRLDHQVKIRGHRVELGEIEAVIGAHASVKECVVVARPGVGGEPRLVAYVVARGGVDADAVRLHVAQRLPAAMVPSSIVVLDAMPRTPNGKTDRKALPAPSARVREVVAPREGAERVLAALWHELLGGGEISADDDFFARGGSSVSAIQLVSRARRRGLALDVARVFAQPRLDAMAAAAGVVEIAASTDVASGPFPLTGSQAGMVFHTLSEPERNPFTSQLVVALDGADVAALRGAWDALVARHEVLRSAFAWDGLGEARAGLPREGRRPLSRPMMVPGAAATLEVRAVDRAEERARPFALDRGPLVRVVIAPSGEVVWTVHHAVVDGWSLGVLTTEWIALARGEVLPPPPAFREVVWWIEARDDRGDEAFWRAELADVEAPPAPPFPRGVAKDAPREYGVAWRPCGVRASATVVHAAWALVIARMTGHDDVVFGSVSSGRASVPMDGIERVVGCLIETLPVRVKVPAGAPVGAWVRGVGERERARWAHEHASLAKIVKWTGARLDTLLAVQTMPDERAEALRLGVGVREVDAMDHVDAALLVQVDLSRAGGLRAIFDRARVDERDAARLLEHLERALAALAHADGATPLHALTIEPGSERAWLDARRPAATAWTGPQTLAEAIEAQVDRTPDAIAVVYEGEAVTYAQLDARANVLATRLREAGVRTDDRVALIAHRSAELVIGLVGILKAGGAYLPIDPELPAARIEFLVADAGARVVLTDETLAEWTRGAAPRMRVPARVDQLAYVIYTSGSTGLPKAAMNEHAPVMNRILWMQDVYRLTADDVVMQKTPYAFDVSVWEFFWALLVGARIAVAKPAGHKTPAYMAELIRAERVTTMHFVPSMLAAFLEDPDLGAMPSLRQVMCSGEALPWETVRRFQERLPGVALHNLYGPTECAVDVTAAPCGDALAMVHRAITIGAPIANTRIHVVDGACDETAIGVPGELMIAGLAVGRGYLGRPELTAEKFIPDPFSAEPGRRMYRSGDLARWLEDGTIDYLGRIDHQVKIRGFRIELGEIETRLLEHPGVAETVVVAREDVPGVKRLVGYVVARTGSLDVAELKAHLAKHLPEYMVPAAFVVMTELPHTPSGKIDRKLLPRPGVARDVDIAPATAAELRVADVFRAVLKLDTIGPHDDVFERGADSITAILIASRLQRIGLAVRPRELLEHPTIARLLAHVGADARARIAAAVEDPALPAPLTPVQVWFFDAALIDAHQFNQAIWIPVRREVPADALEAALRAVHAHHGALRTRFTRDAGGVWASSVGDAPLVVERAATVDVERIQGSMDPAAGRVFAAAITPDRLFLCAHHLVVDGVSWRVILEDLEEAVAQVGRGETIRLREVATPWSTWARALERWAASPACAASADAWDAALAHGGASIPVDATAGDDDVASADVVTVAFTAAETELIVRRAARVLDARVPEVLIAAAWAAFARWTGDGPFKLALEAHGRAEIDDGMDASRTVGWFTSAFPLVLEGARAADDARVRLDGVRARMRAVPERGQAVSYGATRGRAGHPATTVGMGTGAEVVLNYLGILDGDEASTVWAGPLAWEPRGAVSARQARPFLIDLEAAVSGGALTVEFHFGTRRHTRATIEALAAAFAAGVRAIAAAAAAGTAGEDVAPLLPFQEGMLADSLRAGTRTAYVVASVFTATGAIDDGEVGARWADAMARHETLRARFVWQGVERPVMAIAREAPAPPVVIEDLRGLDGAGQRARIDAAVAEEHARGFVLDRGPLFRVRWLRLDEARAALVFTCHHLILDGWSTQALLAEVFGPRVRGRGGGVLGLREVAAAVAARDPEIEERYWRGQAGALAGRTLLPLPVQSAEGARDEGATHEGATSGLPAELLARVEAAGRGHGLTLSTLVHAAWAIVLARVGGVTDVVFGSVASGRASTPGVESTIGCLVSTLPLATRLDAEGGALEWLRGLQGAIWELGRHEHVALAALKRTAGLPPDEPLFDSFVAFENYPAVEARGGVALALDRCLERPLATLSLTFDAVAARPIELVWDRRRVDVATAERVRAAFVDALAALAGVDARTQVGALTGVATTSAAVRSVARAAAPARFVAPRSPLEAAIAAAVGAVLKVDRVGVLDDFFELGGDSILALLVAGRLAQAGHAVSSAQVFAHPTVAALARAIEAAPVAAAARVSGLVPLAARDLEALRAEHPDVEDVYGLTSAQGGIFVDSLESRDPAAYLTQFSWRIDGALDRARFLEAWQTVVARHTALRTSFAWKGLAQPAQLVHRAEDAVEWVEIEHLDVAAAAVEAWLVAERVRPIDLTRAPLLRVAVAHQGASAIVSVVFHHLIFDGWSAGVVIGEVAALIQDPTAPLAPAPAYRALAEAAARVDEPALAQHWTRTLAGVKPSGLPARAGAEPAGNPQGVEKITLDEHETAALLAGARRERVTVAALVHTAWARAYAAALGEREVVFATITAGRSGLAPGDVDRLVGCCVSTVPLRVAVDDDARAVGQALAAASAHEQTSLGAIQRWIGAKGPLVETFVAIESFPGWSGAAGWSPPTSTGRSSFPLGLFAEVGPRLTLGIQFDRRRVADDTARALLTDVVAVLRGAAPRTAATTGAPATVAAIATTAVPGHPLVPRLAALWARVLRTDRVDVDAPFVELGGDSIAALQLVGLAADEGLTFTSRDVFEQETITRLARVVRDEAAHAAALDPPGPVPLTAAQRAFLERFGRAPAVRGAWLTPPPGVPRERFKRAVDAVIAHHPAFRLRFERGPEGWRARRLVAASPLHFAHVSIDALHATIAPDGPIVGAAWVGERLRIAGHVLVVDAPSWAIVARDVDRALDQLAAGETVRLRHRPYQPAADALGEVAFDIPDGELRSVHVELAADVARDLQRLAHRRRKRPHEIVRAALERATGSAVDVEADPGPDRPVGALTPAGAPIRLTMLEPGARTRVHVEDLTRTHASAVVVRLDTTGLSITIENGPPTLGDALVQELTALVRDGAPGPDVEETHALAPVQQGILFHCIATPEAGLYIVQLDLALGADVDVARYHAAWQATVDRHPALRSSFDASALGGPLELVARQAAVPLATVQLTHDAWTQLLVDDRRRGFELARPPLVRLTVATLPDGTRRALVTIHHLVFDGWSQELVLAEVAARYERRAVDGGPAPRFGAYPAWIAQTPPAAAERVFRAMLAGHDTTPLAGARPRDAAPADHAQVTVPFPAGLDAALAARARDAGVTASTLVQTAWSLLLAAGAGTTRTIHGVTVSGRAAPIPGIQATVGCFVNTLPLAVAIVPDEPVLALIRRVHDRVLSIGEHESTALVDVQRWSDVPRGQPLFESVVDVVNVPASAAPAGPHTLRDGTGRTNYALTLYVERGGVTIEHDRARLDEQTVARLGARLATLLGALAERTDRRVRDLPGLDALATGAPATAATASTAPAPAAAPTAPTTDLERRLAALWADVLRTTPGVDDDFFQLGGDSIVVLKLVAHGRRAGLTFTAAQLLQHPTVRRLAAVIAADTRAAAPWPLLAHVPADAPARRLTLATLAPNARAILAARAPAARLDGTTLIAPRTALDRTSLALLAHELTTGTATSHAAAPEGYRAWLDGNRATATAERAHWDATRAANTIHLRTGAPTTATRSLPARAIAARPHTKPHELFLAGVVRALSTHLGAGTLVASWDGFGRELRALAETPDLLGPLDDGFPVALPLGPGDPIAAAKHALRTTPRLGAGFVHATPSTPPPAVAISFDPTPPLVPPTAPLAIAGALERGGPTLHLTVVGPDADPLADRIVAALTSLPTDDTPVSPVDFPDAGLEQGSLDKLLGSLGGPRPRKRIP